MKKNETNQQFLERIMNFGCPTGPMAEVFILQAIEAYAKQVASAPAPKMGFISGEAWKSTAEFLVKELDKRYAK